MAMAHSRCTIRSYRTPLRLETAHEGLLALNTTRKKSNIASGFGITTAFAAAGSHLRISGPSVGCGFGGFPRPTSQDTSPDINDNQRCPTKVASRLQRSVGSPSTILFAHPACNITIRQHSDATVCPSHARGRSI